MNKRTFTPKEKANVALAAIKSEKTLAEISSLYQVHATQIGKWKKTVETELPNIFSDKRKKQDVHKDELIDELYKVIGQRDMELDWLKKKLQITDS